MEISFHGRFNCNTLRVSIGNQVENEFFLNMLTLKITDTLRNFIFTSQQRILNHETSKFSRTFCVRELQITIFKLK